MSRNTSRQDAAPGHDDRFDRLRLISWWDQERLAAARVVVIGAGALGNEILKNLALLGVGRVFIADLDRVENSNLSRSILYRAADNGRPKVEAAAASVRGIFPGIRVATFQGNVVHDLGLGIYHWADVILGGLDNREARLAINRAAWRTGRPWIDGAIEQLSGVARVFVPPASACYECTMNARDWEMLEARRSCALLSRAEMEAGKVPTTPTSASVVAAIQVQEAVKILHGLETLAGKGFVFNGLTHDSYVVEYARRDDCASHDAFEPLAALPAGVNDLTLSDLLAQARRDLGPAAVVELNRDVIESLECPRCGEREPLFLSLGKVTEAEGWCPRCSTMRRPNTFHTVRGDEAFLDRTLAAVGVPPWDIVSRRVGQTEQFYLLDGDRDKVLGELDEPAEVEVLEE